VGSLGGEKTHIYNSLYIWVHDPKMIKHANSPSIIICAIEYKVSLCTNPLADIFALKAVKPKMRDLALIPIEMTQMSPRGGVNRQLKLLRKACTNAEIN
jgi:hypothetical protein